MKNLRILLLGAILFSFSLLNAQEYYYAVFEGDTINLQVSGENGTIQWQEAESEAGPWTNIAGATSSNYTLNSSNSGTGYKFYRAEITNNSICVMPWYSKLIKHRIITSTNDVQLTDWFEGGFVFNIDGLGGGLISASDDASMGASWGCSGTDIPGTSSNIGSGQSNTTAIITACTSSNIPAKICDSFFFNGYDDWFLPSSNELFQMYESLHLNGLGNFENAQYWSSTQYDNQTAKDVLFSNGYILDANKDDEHKVRAARAFAPPYNVQQRLNAGEHPKQIFDSGMPLDSLYGKFYAGGQIFYLNTTNGTGYVATEQDYGEAQWGCHGTEIAGANSTAIGTGFANTQNIVTGCGDANIAAKIANDLIVNGFDDWFLPAQEALELMYHNLKENGYGMTVNYYWSSTQLSTTSAIRIYCQGTTFSGGISNTKSMSHYVKPIRAFTAVPLVTDIDGNIYETVQIGTQIWMVEDLKVTHYPNGNPIPLVTDNTVWGNINDNNTNDAHCFYNNDNTTDYGALYTYASAIGDNWARDNVENQGVCPDGWHLPSDAEWTILTDYLGGENVAGGKMKEIGTTHWSSPNTGADNSSGFSALPSGFRNDGGGFSNLGDYGYWWSATENSSSHAYRRFLNYPDAGAGRNDINKSNGFSVRCVRD